MAAWPHTLSLGEILSLACRATAPHNVVPEGCHRRPHPWRMNRVLLSSPQSIIKCLHAHEYTKNHNSLGCERPSGLDVKQSPNVQDTFQPIPGLISCAGVTGSVGITYHAHATQMAGLKLVLHSHTAWQSMVVLASFSLGFTSHHV